MNQPNFLFQTLKVTESNHVEPQKGDSPLPSAFLPTLLPSSVRSEVLLDLSRTLLKIPRGFQSKQVTMKAVLEVTRKEATVTSKADLWIPSVYSSSAALLVHRLGSSAGLRWAPKEEQPTLISPSKPGYFTSGVKTVRYGTVGHGIGFM